MRFQPDTWFDAVLRPVAMAAPDGNVYAELMAPDFRFVFALVLFVLLVGMTLRRRHRDDAGTVTTAPRRPVFLLLAALALAFVPWLATTGNGRYFLPALLAVGPVCVGLAWVLPATRGARLALALGMVALQAFAVTQAPPWRAWGLAAWTGAPYFQVDLPPQETARPATYVTMAAISYSLLAPRFHPQSRWINLHQAPAPGSRSPLARRTEAFLAEAGEGPIRLLVPALRDMMTEQRLPDSRVSAVINEQLAPFGLGFVQPQSCSFLASRTLAGMGLGEKSAQARARSGFWLCALVRQQVTARDPRGGRHDTVFRTVETQCPRQFPAGGDAGSVALPTGEMRSYFYAEMKLYVYDGGEVYYKYYRALNPVLVGRVEDVLSGRAKVDCGRIRGRSGLPWNRES